MSGVLYMLRIQPAHECVFRSLPKEAIACVTLALLILYRLVSDVVTQAEYMQKHHNFPCPTELKYA